MTDFDRIIDRTKVPALKFRRESMQSVFGRPDLWPSWVADMDFEVAPPITDALMARARHRVFGYEYRADEVLNAIIQWHQIRHDWRIEKQQILFSPSILNSIASLINIFTDEGDGVIVQPPVFFDFKLILKHNNREAVTNPLLFDAGRYSIDFDDMAEKAARRHVKVIILCNPHNPVGRVWTRIELERVGAICEANNIMVISDEIHADITFDGHRHIPFAGLSKVLSEQTITCLSPAKAFNVAGSVNSMMIVAKQQWRKKIEAWYNRLEINKNNAFANVIIQTAYSKGGAWLDDAVAYIADNAAFVRTFLEQRIPQIELVQPEGTFLVWLDCRGLGLDPKALHRFFVDQAGLALNAGHWFGREGAGFARMNIACPRSVLEKGLSKLEQAVSNHKSMSMGT